MFLLWGIEINAFLDYSFFNMSRIADFFELSQLCITAQRVELLEEVSDIHISSARY